MYVTLSLTKCNIVVSLQSCIQSQHRTTTTRATFRHRPWRACNDVTVLASHIVFEHRSSTAATVTCEWKRKNTSGRRWRVSSSSSARRELCLVPSASSCCSHPPSPSLCSSEAPPPTTTCFRSRSPDVKKENFLKNKEDYLIECLDNQLKFVQSLLSLICLHVCYTCESLAF